MRDTIWVERQSSSDCVWEKLVARVSPAMNELIESRIAAGTGPRSRQELFVAAMRLYFEAVWPEVVADEPLDGIDFCHVHRRKLGMT